MKRNKILLIEPDYKNKFPPLGLMKIASYHALLGDQVSFYKGKNTQLRDCEWSAIYITTLFTFQWNNTIDTIKFYSRSNSPVYIGGILATLMPDEVEKVTCIKPKTGPFKGDIEEILKIITRDHVLFELYEDIQKRGIDALPPDYSIFDGHDVPYRKILDSCYIFRTSKGCSRKCKFCSVGILHPEFIEEIKIRPIIHYIKNNYGEKENLVLLDDNVLQSRFFNDIIDEIKTIGFYKNAKAKRKRRWVDFNQGLDIRLLTKGKINKLASIELRPLRLAFDDIALKEMYLKKINWAIDAGFKEISTYILYNYNDTPGDFYERLEIACSLNHKRRCRIYSFPMKYIPCNERTRTFLSPYWSKRQIRGVQCILNASHGIAPAKSDFFYMAFGNNVNEFLKIIQMPENYIIHRYNDKEISKKVAIWNQLYSTMSKNDLVIAKDLISGGKGNVKFETDNLVILDFLSHYHNESMNKREIKI